MEEEGGKSAIDRLREGLYKRVRPEERGRSGFYEREFSVPQEWGDSPAAPDLTGQGVGGTKKSFFSNFFTMRKLLIAAFIFFGIAVAFFLFVVLRGANIVSTRNVSILVDAPTAVEAGEEVALKISIENNNSTPLEFADLIIEFPQGTRVAKNLEQELTRFRRSVGTIGAGKTVTETVDAVLFGQEGDEKKIAISLEYRTKGSGAIFVAEREYQAHISASPFTLAVVAPAEVSAKQEFAFEVELSSKTDETVEDVVVAVDYPFGFSFVGSSPAPSFGNDTWFLGDIPKEGKRTVTVRGLLEGQDGDDKVFRIEGGLAEAGGTSRLGVVYGSTLKTVRIVRPSLGVTLSLSGSAEEEVAIPSGRRIDGEILLANNTPTKITDIRIGAELSGDVLDKTSVAATGGFYRSIDSTIIWDKNSAAKLAELAPGENTRLPFSFAALSPLGSGVRIKNPVITLNAVADANHLGSDGVFKKINIESSQVAKIMSDVELAARAVYYEGPFGNIGPMPPKAEQETTYTIFWTIVNTANDLRSVTVSAQLPQYMRWTGATSPSGESVSYDPDTRMVMWRAGDVVAWRGVASLPREVVFQVGLLPSVSQIGRAPVLAEEASLSAVDEFTDSSLADTSPAVTTNLIADSRFVSGNAEVTQ